MAPLTRRGLMLAAGGVAVGAAGGIALDGGGDSSSGHGTGIVPFHGPHQAGITTPQQDRLQFAAFDLTSDRVEDLRDLLRQWTDVAARLTAGERVGGPDTNPNAPPVDTGEAAGLLPSRLTITFGLGRQLFELHGKDRLGLRKRMPHALRALPALPGDELDPANSGGDLCVQACSDDPQVAFHAVRNLARVGRGLTVMRWSQLGFGRTSSTSRAQETPRNLMGFKDGTNNITGEDPASLREHVWVPASDGPDWMVGGSYVVARRIRILVEVWDRAALGDQEATIGRHKDSGAPIGQKRERDPLALRARGADGLLRIPPKAHVRLAAPASNDGIRILRRGYSFTDGLDPVLGQLDAGLFFLAYQRDAHKQFVGLQQSLGSTDALNEYIQHVSSALFAVPPGIPDRPGRFIADALLARA